MEWFDFATYGFFAGVIGQAFFPSTDPITSLLAAFGCSRRAFWLGRSGAAVFGHLGDRYGRRFVLRLSLLLMGGRPC